MTTDRAMRYALEHYPCDPESDYCTVVRLRKKAVALPEYGVDGSARDESDWAYFDMMEKIDTGMYGSVCYFKDTDIEEGD
jgi:hypothetical protein